MNDAEMNNYKNMLLTVQPIEMIGVKHHRIFTETCNCNNINNLRPILKCEIS